MENGANINVFANERSKTILLESVSEEVTKKINFILEHSDFDKIHAEVNVFNVAFYMKPLPWFIWKPILKHLAKLQTLDSSAPISFKYYFRARPTQELL